MAKTKVKDVISVMEKIAPSCLAMEDDKIGLQVGGEDINVDAILICLDVTEDVLDEAKEKGTDLIIAHHPLIYQPLQELIFSKPPGSVIQKAVSSNISIYIAHTNLDVASGGVNDALIETLRQDWKIKKIEPLLPIKDKPECGLGKLVLLEEGKDFNEFVLTTKNKLCAQNVRVTKVKNTKIDTIALCGGSCREVVYPAWQKKAELLITGELPYHSLLEAKSLGLSVIEAGHYETEVIVLPFLKEMLEKELKEKGWEGKILISKICTKPYLTENLI
ncbi:Nif3-like dinuclear metal center hexameric protein [Candidatus Aerophobetes bacterium]|nr:Nif3-like dinuclear metal center hexameric protein [Candidatus Aerophobetes bacterium]